MVLAFASLRPTARPSSAQQLTATQTAWNRMSLVNIAGAGRFAGRTGPSATTPRNIWRASPVPPVKNLSAKKPEK